MTRFALLVALTFTATIVHANEWPVATPTGTKAAGALLDKCLADGGLKMASRPKGDAKFPEVADVKRLRATVAARRDALTPDLRDALIVRISETDSPEDAGLIALLAAIAEESKDDKARGFVALFRASNDRDAGRSFNALLGFATAAKCFEQAREYGWEATARNERGTLLSRSGSLDAAVVEHKQALAIRQLAFGPKAPILAVSHNNLGATYHRLGRLAEAATEHESAVRIRRAAGVPPKVLAHSLAQLGVVRIEMGDAEAADRALGEALGLAQKGKDRAQLADILGALGGVAEARGDYDTFIRYAREAGDMLLELHGTVRHRDVLVAVTNIGNAHHRRGDFHGAMVMHEVVLHNRRELFGDDPDTAISLNNLAMTYLELGFLSNAEVRAAECLAMRRRLYRGNHPQVARALNNLASVKDKRGDATAIVLLREALTMWEAVHAGRPHPDSASCLDNLAAFFGKTGDYTEAARYAAQAADQFHRLYGETHPEYAAALGNRAFFLHMAGDPTAPDLLNRAVAATALRPGRLPPPDQLTANDFRPLPQTVSLLYHRGRLAEDVIAADPTAAGWVDVARDYTLSAAVLERVRRNNLDTTQSRGSIGEERHDLFVRLVGARGRLFRQDGKTEHLEAAFGVAEQATARRFLDALSASRVSRLAAIPPNFRPQAAKLATRRQDLDRRFDRLTEGPTAAAALFEESRVLRVEEEKFDRQLAAEHPTSVDWTRPRICTLAEARSCLGANEAAVIYLTGADASYAVVLNARPAPDDPACGLAVVPLPPARVLTARVAVATDPDTLRHDVRARDVGQDLYDLLLAPLAKHVAGKDLVIVPGGDLGGLPFELLVNGDRYLVETRRVRYAPSLSALHLQRQWDRGRVRPDRPLFAVGDPVYGPPDPRAGTIAVRRQSKDLLDEYQARNGLARQPLARLKATGAEVEGIRKLFGAGTEAIKVGPRATEEVIKAASASGELARCRFIHFATHGFLGLEGGRQPALVLSLINAPGDTGGAEDGFLVLSEVLELKLNADLVVLSACETGRGRAYRAEGVEGLARAFLYAGSRGVMCSLWSVDDAATAELMGAMYTRLKDGATSADALRSAQLAMVKAGRPPFYWAAFILNGE